MLLLALTGIILVWRRQQILWTEFAELQGRDYLDRKYAEFGRVGSMDIVFQDPNTVDADNNFSSEYVVGINYSWSKQRYEHLVGVFDLDPRKEAAFVQAAAAHYQSDSTLLVVMSAMGDSTDVMVDRKTNPAKLDDLPPEFFEYMMWRRERVIFSNGTLKTRLLEEMNQHMF
ncbi:hypothetical protein [Hymenobacter koreensis]|uniref:DUF4105 domain-containing protein n=1 Tax=Hymenobacter koreensis TaxID=1084523 RepID=A0ABP8J593_9BACT